MSVTVTLFIVILTLTGCVSIWSGDGTAQNKYHGDNNYCKLLAEQACMGMMLNPIRESICEIRMTKSCMNGKGWK